MQGLLPEMFQQRIENEHNCTKQTVLPAIVGIFPIKLMWKAPKRVLFNCTYIHLNCAQLNHDDNMIPFNILSYFLCKYAVNN